MEITETDATPSLASRTLNAIIKLEEVLLSILLTVMILLACYQIGLRWFTSGGLAWTPSATSCSGSLNSGSTC